MSSHWLPPLRSWAANLSHMCVKEQSLIDGCSRIISTPWVPVLQPEHRWLAYFLLPFMASKITRTPSLHLADNSGAVANNIAEFLNCFTEPQLSFSAASAEKLRAPT